MDESIGAPRLPVELRLSTAQRVRGAVLQLWWFVPIMAINLLPRSEAVSPWWFAVAALFWVAVLMVDVRRRARFVVRLTEETLYHGRDDGRNMASLGGQVEVRWRDVRNVRVIERRWSRQVLIDGPGAMNFLFLPRSTQFNPDPQFDARLELIGETWLAQRGPLPPPPPPLAPTAGSGSGSAG